MTAKERFLKYVKIDTTSDENSSRFPSTESQLVLLDLLKEELISMGVEASMDKNGYVIGKINSNCESKNKICFISHVDTSPAVSGKVEPKTLVYNGGDILLGENAVISESDNPELKEYIGKEIITSDGSSLLGADDKAGVSEIMTAVEYIVSHKEFLHGEIYIAFTSDEEIGRGVDHFDRESFGADFGFTVDGGKLGEIEYENFNAASFELTVNGNSIHPGSAKNKMKNAIDLFCEFHSMLPFAERPVSTEKYEGFYMASDAEGGVEKFKCKYIIRDHDAKQFENKKSFVYSVIDFLNKKYGEGVFVADIKDNYYNMAEIIRDNYHLIENAEKAMRKAGVEPVIVPIRGGTDGARLSFMGLPCPNLSTGGLNFHSRTEYVPSFALDKMVEVILNIVSEYAR
ncbi:MAG: peptidase T [Clostridia bacterium]|nr:peptidase T [Clostridia bacterium]